MPVQAQSLDTRIPLASQTADVPGAVIRGYTMRDQEIDLRQKEQAEVRQNNDRAVLDEYLAQPETNFTTTKGLDRALTDLRGKVSSDTFLRMGDQRKKVEQAEHAFQLGLQKLGEGALDLHGKQLDKSIQYLTMPLMTYEQTLKTKGKADADLEFDTVRKQVLAQAAQEMGPDGQPMFPPNVLQQLAQASPTHLKMLLATTATHRAMVEDAYKESQMRRNNALAEFDLARAKFYKDGGPDVMKSEFARIDADVAAGRITAEQGEAMKKGIVAKKSAPAEVSSLTPEAVEMAATDYYLTKALPARLTPAERTKILNRASEIATENGDQAEAVSARQAANKSRQMAMNDITKRMSLIDTFERDADKRLGLVLELAKKADLSGVPALNRWINAGRTNIAGDEDVNNLNSAMISAQAELAKILSGALGNTAVSDSARAEAAVIINKNMTPGQLESLVPNIRRELAFKKEAFKETLKELQVGMQTPKAQDTRTAAEKAAHQESKDPAKMDARKRIVKEEYLKEHAAYKKFDPNASETADARNRKRGDVEALRREWVSLGGKANELPALEDNSTAPAVALPPDIAAILQKHGAKPK